ncbi:MAG: aminotransferase class V-fold PLP-dependent enzyme [Niabella sp.]|nr:MAG: aminotransferase class V-fold PLP-dependent enzyme [Niabella sp.]
MIPLIKSTFYNEEKVKKELIAFIKKSDKLSFGAECEKFEKNFAKYQERKRCVFVNSGSSANLALIQALLNLKRLKRGDNVAFSALTWATNAMPLIQLGLNPVPVDIEIETLNISSQNFLEVIKKNKVKALFITNILGFCGDIDKIKKICKEKDIILIEDNCESLGTIYKGKKLGNFGLASTCSFYVGHHMSTIEGGSICTDDNELADMLSLVRAHGWDRNLDFSKQDKIRKKFNVNSTFYSRYTFYDLGYNLRPTEINGFIGNQELKHINKIVKQRNKNFLKIAKIIYKNDNFFPLKYDHIEFISNFAIPIVCKTEEIRDKIVKDCEGKIEIRPIVGGDLTRQPFFAKYVSKKYKNPNAKLAHERGLYLGNNPELTDKDIDKIIKILSK